MPGNSHAPKFVMPCIYPTGIKVTDKQLAAVRLRPALFHGEWNYRVLPHRQTQSRYFVAKPQLEDIAYATTHWELASLDDPYDIKRVRLLYQWQVGYISFDELEQQWNPICDRTVLDGIGKPILGKDGRPTFLPLPLPVARDTKRDWITDIFFKSRGGLAGRSGPVGVPGTTTVWVADTEGASQFSLAILSAMANTRVKARWGDAAMISQASSNPLEQSPLGENSRLARALQRSESRRALLLLGLLVRLIVLATLRNVTGSVAMQGSAFTARLIVKGAAALYAGMIIFIVRRAESGNILLPSLFWVRTAVVESAIPSVNIIASLIHSRIDPLDVLAPSPSSKAPRKTKPLRPAARCS